MALIAAHYIGVDGSRWDFGMDDDSVGVILGSVSGLVAKVDRATVGRSTGRGVDVREQSVADMSGTLDLLITDDRARSMTLGDVYYGFTDAWSQWRDGELSVTDSRATEWLAPARLSEGLDPPARSPQTPGLYRIEVSLPVWVRAGLWASRPETVAGPTVDVENRGIFPMFPDVRWSGSGQTVTIPTGQVIALPSVSAPHVLSTDPGEGFRIVTESGDPADDVWASMRGRSVVGRIEPGTTARWSMTYGVSLIVTALTDNPWR